MANYERTNNQQLLFKINSEEKVDKVITSGLIEIFKSKGYFLNEIDEDSRDHHICLNINDSSFIIEIAKLAQADGNWYTLDPFNRKTILSNWDEIQAVYQPIIDEYIKGNFQLLHYKWNNPDEDHRELVYGKEFMDNFRRMTKDLNL